MKRIKLNQDLKISVYLALIGFFAGVFTAIWQLDSLLFAQSIPDTVSRETIILSAGLQVLLMTFVLSFIGIKLARRVGLRLRSQFTRNNIWLTIIASGLLAFIIVAADKFVFAQYLGSYTDSTYQFSFMELLSSIFYGGIIEEVLLRLFMVSLLVYILYKLFAGRRSASEIPAWIYLTAIFIAALAFAAGHLPATKVAFGLSTPIVIRAFLLNGLAGLVLGYIYWRRGLALAMATHAGIHLFRIFIFMPLFF